MPPIFEIRDLTISFPGNGNSVNALKHFNCSLEPGRTLGIVGESGSGKTITVLAAMGLLNEPPARIESGRIMFSLPGRPAVDLLKLADNEMRKIRGKEIGMIFQEPMTSLNPVMKCGQQVSEVLRAHEGLSSREAKSEVLRWFREVKLPSPETVYHKWPHQISGGQKQRVMMAMAMACQPRILIADEPTTALDVTVQRSILELLRQLQEKYGMAMVFITHDLGVIAEIAHEVIVMRQGEILETGSPEKIFSSPVHAYTRSLLNCKPDIENRRSRLPVSGTEPFGDLTGPPSQPHRSSQSTCEVPQPYLELRDITVRFRSKAGFRTILHDAVDKVTLHAFRGETLGLVGESGCGKTTLGRSIVKLVNLHNGQITLDGVDIYDQKNRNKGFRKRVQIIFQDPYATLNPRMPVGEAIQEPIRVHRIKRGAAARRAHAEWLLTRVGLSSDHFNRYPHEFSGGQRQRIGIARALAVHPEFIICDESVSALDVSVQAQILNLLNDLKEEFGFTFIFISHDLSVIHHMSDRVAVMKDGKIVETGQTDELFAHPKTAYTKRLLDAIPKITKKEYE